MDILPSLKSRLAKANSGLSTLVNNGLKSVNTHIDRNEKPPQKDFLTELGKFHNLPPADQTYDALDDALSTPIKPAKYALDELVIKPFFRASAKIATTLAGEDIFKPSDYGSFGKKLYGDEDIMSIPKVAREGPVTKWMEKRGIPSNVAVPIAFTGATVLAVADLVPFAGVGKKKAAEEIASIAPKVIKPTLKTVKTVETAEDILNVARKEIGKTTKTKTGVKKWLNTFYTDWVNEWHPIDSLTSKYEKMVGSEIPTGENPKYLIKRLLGTGAAAEYKHKHVLDPILDTVADIPKEDFDVFLKAKRDIGFAEAGRVIEGSNSELAYRRITALTEKYGAEAAKRLESTASELYKYQDDCLKKLMDTGFIDPTTYTSIKGKNINYAPFKRVMDDVDTYLGTGTRAMVGAQPIKTIGGSLRKIYSPVESIIANTYKTENLVSKNNVARSIADLRTIVDDGTIVPLRTAANVKKRIDIFTELGVSKKAKNKLERLVVTRGKWAREVESELNKLNKAGLEQYLKRKPSDVLEGATSSIRTKVKDGVETSRSIITEDPGGRKVKKFINQLVAEAPDKIAAIKKKVSVRDARLGTVLDDVVELSQELKTVKNSRAGLLDEARLLKDAESRGKATIAVWRDGVKELYEVPKDIEVAVKGLNHENLNTLTKILSAPASLFRQAQTGRNLDFMVPNMVKDQLDAAVNSRYGYRPFIDYISGLTELIEFDRTGNNKIIQKWLVNGGGMSFGKMSGRAGVSEQVLDATTKKGAFKQLISWVTEGLDVAGRYSESPTRIGLFKRVLKKTNNVDKAVMESREAIVDYPRMGAKMRTANALINFLNPGIQGFDKMFRVAKADPKGFILRLGVYGALPATTVSLYNNVFYSKEYEAVPQWEKGANFIIMTGARVNGKPSYIKIPKGNVIPMIANPVDHFITYLFNNDRQSFYSMAASVFSDLVPVISEGESISEIATRTLGANTPQAVKPLIETAFNFDSFKGRPIVPYYTGFKEPSKQTFSTTPEAYNMIGELLNVSPLKVKHLAEGYLAGYVKMPTNVLTTLKSITDNRPVDPNQLLILRRFFGNYEDYTTPIKKNTYDPFSADKFLKRPGPTLK